jgi:hypothetical protein
VNLPRDFSGAGRGDPPSRRRGRKPENKADNNDEGKDDDRGNLPVRQQMVYTTNTAPLRWFETVNPAAAPVNTGEGLLMQAYTLSLANFCR